jgi:hypothetical protein
MRLFKFVIQLLRFCEEVFVNWIMYGLFVTSLPALVGFLPSTQAQLVKCWISANAGPRTTVWFVILGIFLASFVAWKQKDDELRHKVNPQTLAILAALLTEAGDLFDKGRTLPPDKLNELRDEFATWHRKVSQAIRMNVSDTEAALFREPSGGVAIRYVPDRTQNQILNTLCGYQENLRQLIKRLADQR